LRASIKSNPYGFILLGTAVYHSYYIRNFNRSLGTMKISDLRKELDKIEEAEGDIEVLIFDAESDDLYSNPVVRVENCANIFSEDCWRT
jgi:hypothetical protein